MLIVCYTLDLVLCEASDPHCNDLRRPKGASAKIASTSGKLANQDDHSHNAELAELSAAQPFKHRYLRKRQEAWAYYVQPMRHKERKPVRDLPKPKPMMFPAWVILLCQAFAALSCSGGVTSSSKLRKDAWSALRAKSSR